MKKIKERHFRVREIICEVGEAKVPVKNHIRMEKDTSCSPIKESRANSWIIGLAIVEFDIEEG